MLDLCSIVRSRLIARTVETCLFNALTTRKKWIFYASLRMHPVLPDSTERTPRACGARGTPPALLLDLEIKKKEREGGSERIPPTNSALWWILSRSRDKKWYLCGGYLSRWQTFLSPVNYYGPAVLKFRSTWMINENFPEKMLAPREINHLHGAINYGRTAM